MRPADVRGAALIVRRWGGVGGRVTGVRVEAARAPGFISRAPPQQLSK